MDAIDKAKLKVLVKMLLIQRSPKHYTAKQLSDIINLYDWGFHSPITTKSLTNIINYELGKNGHHFLEDIECKKRGNYRIFKYVGE